MLINVASTVKEGALYPAKPYHEDVDFAHLCNERQLVVVKCNWLYFHKVMMHLANSIMCHTACLMLASCVVKTSACKALMSLRVPCCCQYT